MPDLEDYILARKAEHFSDLMQRLADHLRRGSPKVEAIKHEISQLIHSSLELQLLFQKEDFPMQPGTIDEKPDPIPTTESIEKQSEDNPTDRKYIKERLQVYTRLYANERSKENIHWVRFKTKMFGKYKDVNLVQFFMRFHPFVKRFTNDMMSGGVISTENKDLFIQKLYVTINDTQCALSEYTIRALEHNRSLRDFLQEMLCQVNVPDYKGILCPGGISATSSWIIPTTISRPKTSPVKKIKPQSTRQNLTKQTLSTEEIKPQTTVKISNSIPAQSLLNQNLGAPEPLWEKEPNLISYLMSAKNKYIRQLPSFIKTSNERGSLQYYHSERQQLSFEAKKLFVISYAAFVRELRSLLAHHEGLDNMHLSEFFTVLLKKEIQVVQDDRQQQQIKLNEEKLLKYIENPLIRIVTPILEKVLEEHRLRQKKSGSDSF